MASLTIGKIVVIPVISALIGWFTNWVAIKMLFHPRKPINCFFFTLHGIFYKRQKELAKKLGSTIEDKLFSISDISQVLTSDEFNISIKKLLDDYIDDLVKNRLASIHPMLAMVPPEMQGIIREKLSEEFDKLLPSLLKSAEEGLASNMDISEMIRGKVEAFEVAELEDVLFGILKKEFSHIEYIGGFLGFFIGLSQLAIVHFF